MKERKVTPLVIPPEIMSKMWGFFMETSIPRSIKIKRAEEAERLRGEEEE